MEIHDMSTVVDTTPEAEETAAALLEDQVTSYKRDGFTVIEDVLLFTLQHIFDYNKAVALVSVDLVVKKRLGAGCGLG